jgi:hypothetical protein
MSYKQAAMTPPPGKKARMDPPKNERPSSPQNSPLKQENEDNETSKDEGLRRR